MLIQQRLFESGFEAAAYRLSSCTADHRLDLPALVLRPGIFLGGICVVSGFLLVPWLGRDFFPNTDSGQFRLHVRTKAGTRIEETARVCDLVENSIRRQVPGPEMESILDNIGLPYSGFNNVYNNSGVIGSADTDILVSLKEGHQPTQQWVQELRRMI